MHQPALFRCLQRRGHLQRDIERCQNIEQPQATNPFLERFAFDQFHGVKELAGLLGNTELIHRCDIKMP